MANLLPDFIDLPEPTPPRRSRGAPPGNLNALKHGFYSRLFHKIELNDLQQRSKDLEDEISMLRVLIRRVVESSQQASTLDENLRLLTVLSQATANLGRLIRIQYLVAGHQPSEIDIAITTVLQELAEQYGWNESK